MYKALCWLLWKKPRWWWGGRETSSVFIQDGDGQCVWELVVGAPIEETAEWEGMEKVRMRNLIVHFTEWENKWITAG